MKLIYTAGVFDLLHPGHLNLLWRSKQLGDVLVVGLVDGEGVMAYKGRYPVEDYQLRKSRLERLSFVDVIVRQATTDPTENLERFQPDVFTHGDDWSRLREGHETLERLGIEFVTLPYTPGVSSTMLREKQQSRFLWSQQPATVTR